MAVYALYKRIGLLGGCAGREKAELHGTEGTENSTENGAGTLLSV